MLGAGSGSGVRGGGGDDVEEALGDAVAAAAGSVLLGGEILIFSMSGRIVWGSGMVGRIGRIGADSEGDWVAGLAGDDAGDDALGGDARAGGLAALPLGGGGGDRTVTTSPETSSTELSSVTVACLLVVMSSA